MLGPQPPFDFFEKNLTVRSDPFDRWDWPGMIGMIQAYYTRRGCIFIGLGHTQSWKTFVNSLWSLYSLIFGGGEIGWYTKTDRLGKDTAIKKINNLWEQPRSIEWILPDRDNKVMQKTIGNDSFTMFSQNIVGDRINKTLMTIIGDETWTWDPGNLTDIQKRRGANEIQGLFREMHSSTGGLLGCELYHLSRRATVFRFAVPCKYCGKPMVYRIFPPRPIPYDDAIEQGISGDEEEKNGEKMIRPWGGLRFRMDEEVWNEFGEVRRDIVEPSIYHSCEHCGGKHYWDAGERDRMVVDSVKIFVEKHGWDLSHLNHPGSWYGYELVKKGERDIIQFEWDALMTRSWWEIAYEWLKADRFRQEGQWQEVEKFYREVAGKYFSLGRHMIEQTNKSSCIGAYMLCPPNEEFKPLEWWPELAKIRHWVPVLTVDVQQNHFYIVVRIWAKMPEGLRTRLVWHERIWSIDEVERLRKHYGALDHGNRIAYNDIAGKYFLLAPGCTTMIDGNYDPGNMVKTAARNFRWVIFRGRTPKGTMHPSLFYHAEDNTHRFYGNIQLIDTFEGTIHQSPVESRSPKNGRWAIEIPYAARECMDTLQAYIGNGGSDPIWTKAENRSADYDKQLGAWVQVPMTKKDGTQSFLRQQIHHDDHYFSCEMMQIGVVSMFGWIGVNVAQPVMGSESNENSS